MENQLAALGLSLETLTPELAKQFDVQEKKRVLITDVEAVLQLFPACSLATSSWRQTISRLPLSASFSPSFSKARTKTRYCF